MPRRRPIYGMRFPGRSGGQSAVEYAVVIAVVVGALLAMALYMKRGTMGKLRESTDSLGGQFSPLQTATESTRTSDVGRHVTQAENGASTDTIAAGRPEVRTRKGKEDVDALSTETLF